jgi:thioredoxin reductase
MDRQQLPVLVIGAGPVGLAAAAHLVSRGIEPLVLERGESAGASVGEWGHVRFFSPWKYSIDEAARALLKPTGWTEPEPEAFPTGNDLVTRYMRPLAEAPELKPHIRYGTEVVAVTRDGFDRMKSPGRDDAPFLVVTRSGDDEQVIQARAVIDASGTWTRPNPLGASGVPAIGERAASDQIAYGIPDVLGSARERYARKRVLVVGSGHSAFNVLLDLIDLADAEPDTTITWGIRKPLERMTNLFGGGINDALPARGELGSRVREQVARGRLELVAGLRIARIERVSDGLLVHGQDEGQVVGPFDEIIGATGFRPDLGVVSELRLALDPAVESPTTLAPLIDPNVHSCGSVPPHGAEELRHPETDFYIVGMKSYGRAPTFLMLTGYEQVRSVAAAIAGDWEAARDVRLVLPETGVCSTSSVLGERGVSCCGTEAAAEASEGASCCGGSEPATVAAGGASSCCGDSAPKVIQLASIGKGGTCC